jgi:hypothetical protein
MQQDVPEAEALRQFLPPEAGNPRQGVVGTMAREVALRILGASAPVALDWLEDNVDGGRRVLPVVDAANEPARSATASRARARMLSA